jgi:outer membrane biosynthesis protein TonB
VHGDAQPVVPTTCAHPYVAATVTHAFEPATPAIAAQQMISGTVYVAVALDERGVPQAARIVTSPSPVINNASLTAAMRSEYTPEVFRCRPVPGGYIFGVGFN